MSGDFAGDLFLTLAAEGRLVLDPGSADEVVAGLERTLALVRSRLRIKRIWEQLPVQRLDELPAELRQDVVDAVFVDQLTPGRLERAAVELPKYIEALRSAGRLPPAG